MFSKNQSIVRIVLLKNHLALVLSVICNFCGKRHPISCIWPLREFVYSISKYICIPKKRKLNLKEPRRYK